MSKPLSPKRLATNNLKTHLNRSIGLIIVIVLFAFSLFSSALLIASLSNGLSNLQDRLGADLAVVPLEHGDDYEGILLSGKPSKFYFDKDLAEKVKSVEGVAKVTTQFYITTLAAECCSSPVQIIGFDADTDFVVQPWIADVYSGKVASGEVIIGSDIHAEDDGTIRFFDKSYPVAAKLDKTSTGTDITVYATLETVKLILEGAKEKGIQLQTDVSEVDVENSISAILIDTQAGFDVDVVVTNIRQKLDGISVVKSQSLFSSISTNIQTLHTILYVVVVLVWVLAVLILSIMFSLIINSRKKEFALLRSLGATKRKLIHIMLAEAVIVGFSGGLVGTLLGAIVILPFHHLIASQLSLPMILPSFWEIALMIVLSFVLATLTGPLSAIISARKIARQEAYTVIREGE